jgi:hypothetical protein
MKVFGKCLNVTTVSAGLAGVMALTGCTAMNAGAGKSAGASQPATTSTHTANYQPVSDVPIPPSTKINTERSAIFGGGERWYGRMVLSLDRSSTMAYAYYLDQMPPFGWELVSAVQGKVSVLTFTRGDRAASVEITPSALRGSEAVVTVSPRPAAGAAAAGNGSSAAPKK